MAYAERLSLIAKIEELRKSKVLCYLTSIRQNVSAQMGDDAVRVFFDHLLRLPSRPVDHLDIFLCSNGGSGTVPWRLISLFREFARRVSVLLPYRAYSAATMLAIGADDIVMHPFAEMGPIDPTVSNDYNPVEAGTNRRLGISVEDVKAYIGFIKETAGIKHEDELIKAIEILAQRVHPLALGNVERFLSQSRMIAAKILRTHMKDEGAEHRIEEIVETLASKLYFHGHPINRREAKDELGLKVSDDPSRDLENAMWSLYQDFEIELQNRELFDPSLEIAKRGTQQLTDPNTGQVVVVTSPVEVSLNLALIESQSISSVYTQKIKFTPLPNPGPSGETMIRSESLDQGWRHQDAPAAPPTAPPKARRRPAARSPSRA